MQDIRDLDDASIALCAWFKSQQIIPSDGVILVEFFIARMIVANTRGPEDTEAKLNLLISTIREFIKYIPKDSK